MEQLEIKLYNIWGGTSNIVPIKKKLREETFQIYKVNFRHLDNI